MRENLPCIGLGNTRLPVNGRKYRQPACISKNKHISAKEERVSKKENPVPIDIRSGAMNSKGSFGKRVDLLQDYWTVFIDLDFGRFFTYWIQIVFKGSELVISGN
jgi:hypothetical protein